jgi:hypothetical protein
MARVNRQLGDNTRSMSIHEIEAFVSLLYGRCAEGIRKLLVVKRLKTLFFSWHNVT